MINEFKFAENMTDYVRNNAHGTITIRVNSESYARLVHEFENTARPACWTYSDGWCDITF